MCRKPISRFEVWELKAGRSWDLKPSHNTFFEQMLGKGGSKPFLWRCLPVFLLYQNGQSVKQGSYDILPTEPFQTLIPRESPRRFPWNLSNNWSYTVTGGNPPTLPNRSSLRAVQACPGDVFVPQNHADSGYHLGMGGLAPSLSITSWWPPNPKRFVHALWLHQRPHQNQSAPEPPPDVLRQPQCAMVLRRSPCRLILVGPGFNQYTNSVEKSSCSCNPQRWHPVTIRPVFCSANCNQPLLKMYVPGKFDPHHSFISEVRWSALSPTVRTWVEGVQWTPTRI